MTVLEFALLAFSSLFVIIDPIATVPAFLAMTPDSTAQQRERMARLACLVMVGVLTLFGLLGQTLFRILGISLPAFQIAASLVLFLVALDMLRAQRSRVHETTEETEAGAEKTDIAIAPLAIPMLAGPGAISTVILLEAQAKTWEHVAVLYGCIVATSFLSYVILSFSGHGAKWLSPILLRVITRIMGLLLAAVAAQFALTAIKEFLEKR